MTTNRFDNLPINEMVSREAEASAELEAIREALKDKLISECPVELGMVYRFRDDILNPQDRPSYLRKRSILIAYINAARPRWKNDRWSVSIQGFLSNPKSTTGDGFNRKIYEMNGWDKLDLASAKPGPRQHYNPK